MKVSSKLSKSIKSSKSSKSSKLSKSIKLSKLSKSSKSSKTSNSSKSSNSKKSVNDTLDLSKNNGILSTSSYNEFSKFRNTIIHTQLQLKLEKARTNILKNKDLFIDKEHELMCLYYKKFLELKSKLDLNKTKIFTLIYKKNILHNNNDDDNFLKLNKEDSSFKFKDIKYNYEIKYNDYNKKFINNLQDITNIENINLFLEKQNKFIESLSTREIYNLKYYTYHGDIYINDFLDKKFNIETIKNHGDSIIDSDNNLCYFYYQFKDYFQKNPIYKEEKVPIDDINQFIDFISKNYENFDMKIYKYIFTSYKKELIDIFNKAPKTETPIILYRGVKENYILKKSIRGYYISNHFSSTSLIAEKAVEYTRKNKIIYKIIVNIGLPLIFVEGISLAPNDFEVIIPINSIFYIDNALQEINYFYDRDKNKILCYDENEKNILKVSTIIYTQYIK
jgi:hypothetical protein